MKCVKQVSARCYADQRQLTLKLIKHNAGSDTISKATVSGCLHSYTAFNNPESVIKHANKWLRALTVISGTLIQSSQSAQQKLLISAPFGAGKK